MEGTQAEHFPGPARQWLLRFEQSRLPRIGMLIVGQMLSMLILCFAMVLFWMLLGGTDFWQYTDTNWMQIFFSSALVLWLVLLLWLRGVALRRGLPRYAELFQRRYFLVDIFEQPGGTGDSASFRRRLRGLLRNLPGLLRMAGGGMVEQEAASLLHFALAALVLVAWLTYMQNRLGQNLEFIVLGGLLLAMLAIYRAQLGRLVLELAFARHLLGSDAGQADGEAGEPSNS